MWMDPKKQRNFFDEFARYKNINPLDAAQWYLTTSKEIKQRGGRYILNLYSGSLMKALARLYPEMILKNEKFLLFEERWKSPENLSKETSRNRGGLLHYYKGLKIKALVTLYPRIHTK